jgi:hypothetical protein
MAIRRFTVKQPGVENPAGIPFTLRYHDEIYEGVSGQWGRCEIAYPHSWLSEMTVGGEVVLTDTDIGGRRDLGEIVLHPRGGEKARLRRFSVVRGQDRQPAAGSVVVFIYRGKRHECRVDGFGRAELDYPHEWVDQILIDGVELLKPTSGGKEIGARTDLGTLVIPSRAEDRNISKRVKGVRGQVFYADGTMLHEPVRVSVWVAGREFSTDGPESRCDNKGAFYIAVHLDELQHAATDGRFSIQRMFVNGREIRPKQVFRDPEGFMHVVMPRDFRQLGGKSHRGGMIAGYVVDSEGNPREGVKVTAEVAGGLFGAKTASTRTGKRGRFVLRFEGGARLKRLYVDGREPKKITGADGEELPNSNIHAGHFNLRLERARRWFGFG